MHEDIKVLEDGNNDAEAEGEISAQEPQRGHKMQLVLIDALCPSRLDKVNVRHEDGDPGQEAKDGDQINEIAKYFAGVLGHVKEGDTGDKGGKPKGIDRDAAPIGPGENWGGVPFLGEAIGRARGDVEVAVGGRENEDYDAGIDQSGQHLDAAQNDSNDEWRPRGSGLCLAGCKYESTAIVGDQGSKKEHG